MEKRELLFALDKSCKNAVSYCLQAIRLPKYIVLKKTLKKNKNLKNIKKSEKCYIIGLGPSLKQIDFEKLTDGDLITVNSFYKDPNAARINPVLHIMLDWLSYTVEREDLETALEAFSNSNFLLNAKYYEKKIDGPKRYWICTWGSEKIRNKINITKICPSFDNVINHAIYVAMYMEYKNIVLLGCDFNSFASRKLNHSYGESDRTLTLSHELFAYSFVADSHMKLNIYAKRHNIKIVNASYRSLIDAYEYNEDLAMKLMRK